jgi:hypothetical protein
MAYQYLPLHSPEEAIRLLNIHPGKDEEPLSCTLTPDHVLSHADCPPYAALSYTWGPPTPQHTITINGASFFIRENLWSFLRQLRRLGEHAYIWTDAISINQADVPEKNLQVPLMGRIYKNAARVLVYLGQEADQSQLIMDLAARQPPDCAAEECAIDWRKVDLFHYAPTLFRLCNRPYWDRTWIIQEILLARGQIFVLCGSTMTTLQSLRAVHGSYCDFALFDGGDTASFGGGEDYDFTEKDGLHRLSYNFREATLELLLEVYLETLCADPKDKVYAVQSMAVGSPLAVDYGMDLDEFYWRVMAHCNASTVKFGTLLRTSLGVSSRRLWDFACQKHVLSVLPIMQTSLSKMESVASLQLEEIGMVNSVDYIRDLSNPRKGYTNGVVRIQVTPRSLPIRGLHCLTGFASGTAREGDVICAAPGLQGCGLLMRQNKISPLDSNAHRESTRVRNSIESSFCLLMEPEAHQSTELETIVQSQHRLNTLAGSIVIRGVPTDYLDVVQPPTRLAPDVSLVLNYAAILALSEVSELVQHGIEWSAMTMHNGPGKDLQPE